MTDDHPSPPSWARVEELFLRALDAPAAERDALVDRLSAGDPQLADEVRSLLAAHEGHGFLDTMLEVSAPPAPPVPPPPPPQWVGPYRVLRELGRGGMGTVFLAERSGDGFTQRVALKLIRADFADPRLEAALASERRILARLEHPGIARFIDGGTTPGGQPYVAMEHVQGVPLLDYCEGGDARLEDRLDLFVRTCEAVQHAHRQLVVHRDLKPSNILVTGDARPVLLDFGVARLLDETAGDEDEPATANWITPAYASPEQLRREPVTTLTDVYALGVILFELLTGRLPYDLGDNSLARAVQAICDDPPLTASQVAAAAGRPGLARRLAGDLDTILHKALHKDPTQRYGSVEQLADDIRRHLEGRPVRARPASVPYRMRKFARRHRGGVAGAALLLVSLVAGIAATAWQGRVASEERDRAREALAQSEDVTNFLLDLFRSSDPQRIAEDTVIARGLLRNGLSRVDELSSQPAVQARLLDALAQVLGSLGQYARGQELVERGLALRMQHLGAGHLDVATSYRRLGHLLRLRGDYVHAESLYHAALAIERATLGEGDARIAETVGELAFLMPYLGRPAEAESLYREQHTLRAHILGADHPLTLQSRMLVALRLQLRDPGAAETELRTVLARRRNVLGEQDLDVALTMLHLGDLLVDRHASLDEAEHLFTGALAIQRAQAGERSLLLSHGLNSLASLHLQRDRPREAEELYREVLESRRALLGREHPFALASQEDVARALAAQGRWREAEAMHLEAVAGMRQAYGGEHAVVAGSLSDLARLYEEHGDLANAERYARESLAMRVRILAPTHLLIASSRITLARILERRGSLAEADTLVRAARDLLATQVGPDQEWMVEAARVITRLEARRSGTIGSARVGLAGKGAPRQPRRQ